MFFGFRFAPYNFSKEIQIEIGVIPFLSQIDTYSTVQDVVVNAHYKCCVSNVLHIRFYIFVGIHMYTYVFSTMIQLMEH